MRYTLLFLFLLYSLNWSQVYMNIINRDGTTQSFNIDEVRKLTFNGLVSVEDGKTICNVIKSFTLLQNYPNPFNPSTTIEFQIPKAGNVDVKIYNINGQLVKDIESGFRSTGSYKVNWNSKNNLGQNVSSGIYFSQVKFNNSILTKKILLIK